MSSPFIFRLLLCGVISLCKPFRKVLLSMQTYVLNNQLYLVERTCVKGAAITEVNPTTMPFILCCLYLVPHLHLPELRLPK